MVNDPGSSLMILWQQIVYGQHFPELYYCFFYLQIELNQWKT